MWKFGICVLVVFGAAVLGLGCGAGSGEGEQVQAETAASGDPGSQVAADEAASYVYVDPRAGDAERLTAIFAERGLDFDTLGSKDSNDIGYTFYQQGDIRDAYLMFADAARRDPKNATAWYNRACTLSLLYEQPKDRGFDTKAAEFAYSLDMALFLDPSRLAKIGTDRDLDKLRDSSGYREVYTKFSLAAASAGEGTPAVFLGYHLRQWEYDDSYLSFRIDATDEIVRILDFPESLLHILYVDETAVERARNGDIDVADFPPQQPEGVLPLRILPEVRAGGLGESEIGDEFERLGTHVYLDYVKPL